MWISISTAGFKWDSLSWVISENDFADGELQTASFYSGIANVVAHLLSVVIIVLSVMRRKTKKRVGSMAAQRDEDLEPLRH